MDFELRRQCLRLRCMCWQSLAAIQWISWILEQRGPIKSILSMHVANMFGRSIQSAVMKQQDKARQLHVNLRCVHLISPRRRPAQC